MEMIKYLSIILAEEIKLSPSASSGLIRLAIKDEIGPFTPLHHLNLSDYKTSCENALRRRLSKLGVVNIDQIIKRLMIELIKNQSLATMEKF